jgi:hypothetical protein
LGAGPQPSGEERRGEVDEGHRNKKRREPEQDEERYLADHHERDGGGNENDRRDDVDDGEEAEGQRRAPAARCRDCLCGRKSVGEDVGELTPDRRLRRSAAGSSNPGADGGRNAVRGIGENVNDEGRESRPVESDQVDEPDAQHAPDERTGRQWRPAVDHLVAPIDHVDRHSDAEHGQQRGHERAVDRLDCVDRYAVDLLEELRDDIHGATTGLTGRSVPQSEA